MACYRDTEASKQHKRIEKDLHSEKKKKDNKTFTVLLLGMYHCITASSYIPSIELFILYKNNIISIL